MGKKTTRVRRNFPPEFKRNAVRLLRGGRGVTDVAERLGVARSLLQRWREQIEALAAAPMAMSTAVAPRGGSFYSDVSRQASTPIRFASLPIGWSPYGSSRCQSTGSSCLSIALER